MATVLETSLNMSKSLLKSTSIVASMTLLSRILGFVRDMIVAQFFGATAGVDAFYVAFKIPNFMRALFAEGSFSQAFVPVLSEYRTQRQPEEVKQLICYVAGNLGSILLLITLIAVLLSPLLVMIFAPGFKPGMPRFDLTAHMLRITFPYLLLISLAAFIGAILNSYGVFAVPAFTPVLLNITMICAACFFTKHFNPPVLALAWGVLVAGIIQFLFQLPFIARLGFLSIPRLDWHDSGVQRITKLMLPGLFGASIGQISLLLNTIFASFLPIGSVTWLYYSDRLVFFPLGVFGVALATVVLPQLARYHAKQEVENFSAALVWGIRCNLLIGFPAAISLWLLSGPIIVTLFHYGKFNAFDVLMTQRSVITYAIGLQAFMLVKILSSGFYACQDIRTPVRIGVIAMIANMVLNAVLISPLAHAGLALATSLAAWVNVILLWWCLYKRGYYRKQSNWGRFWWQLCIASLVLIIFLHYFIAPEDAWLAWSGKQRGAHLFIVMLSAMLIYFISLIAAGMRWRDLKAVVSH